eukprot:Amastigsp_a342453_39.p4 type:complete len:112 gc:universal Amastigsp_a342453_39:642-307(-)
MVATHGTRGSGTRHRASMASESRTKSCLAKLGSARRPRAPRLSPSPSPLAPAPAGPAVEYLDRLRGGGPAGAASVFDSDSEHPSSWSSALRLRSRRFESLPRSRRDCCACC